MSGINPKFKEVGAFDEGDTLSRQLVQHENNVADAFNNIASQALPKLTPTQKKTSDYVASLDELINAAGTFTVRLPVASPQNQGRVIGIVVTSGTVTVMSVTGLVQGASSEALTVVGAYLYTSDGVGWWRNGVGNVTSVTAGTGLTGGGTGAVTLAIDSTVVTSAILSAAVQPIRAEMENVRLLLLQLVTLEMGGVPDNLRGIEGLSG